MKKVSVGLAVALMLCLGFQGLAFARNFNGKISAVDAVANTLEITNANPLTGAEEKITVILSPNTTYMGVASSAELKVGDPVSVQAALDPLANKYDALSVERATA